MNSLQLTVQEPTEKVYQQLASHVQPVAGSLMSRVVPRRAERHFSFGVEDSAELKTELKQKEKLIKTQARVIDYYSEQMGTRADLFEWRLQELIHSIE